MLGILSCSWQLKQHQDTAFDLSPVSPARRVGVASQTHRKPPGIRPVAEGLLSITTPLLLLVNQRVGGIGWQYI